MSELKVYVPQDGPYGLVPEEGGEPVEEETCYLKSEADKVIAEKDKTIAELEDKCQMHDFFWEGCGFKKLGGFKNSINVRDYCDELKRQNEDLIPKCRKTNKELRHNKYRRCLAMANYCHESAMWLEENGVNKCTVFMLRWEKRWLELAEKFKEAK